MGVDRSDYVMFAAEVGPDNVEWEEFEDEMNGAPDAKFRIIYDGMSGNYAYAGLVIAQADEYEGFGDGVALDMKQDEWMWVMDQVIAVFPHVTQQDFKLIALSHFS